MPNRRPLTRALALGLSGGFLLQLVGCGVGVAPVLFSLAESMVVSLLLGGLGSP